MQEVTNQKDQLAIAVFSAVRKDPAYDAVVQYFQNAGLDPMQALEAGCKAEKESELGKLQEQLTTTARRVGLPEPFAKNVWMKPAQEGLMK